MPPSTIETSLMNIKKHFLLLVVCSLHLSGCELRESIEIDAPVAAVWSYLGDNSNAANWSVYFKSIRTLSSTGTGQDLAVGTIRRCYRSDDERSPYWDELTLEMEPQKYRKILSYNFQGYQGDHFLHAQFVVHNYFEALGPGRTRLTFANAKWSPDSLASTLALLNWAGTVKDTLRLNLQNIKAAVEAQAMGVPYARKNQYVPVGQHSLDADSRFNP